MKVEKSQPVYVQIEHHLRTAIASGEYPAGTKLPSVQELATQFGTSVFTIQTALAPLERDGLVNRTPRRGTYVQHAGNRLATVGIYFGADFWQQSNKAFYRQLERELAAEFSQEKIRSRMWVDSRPVNSQAEPLKELETAVANKELQGLIGLVLNPNDMQWLSRLNVPITIIGTAPLASRVGQDFRQMLGDAMDALKAQGCRSVGFIFPRPVWGPEESDHADDIVGVFRDFVNQAADRGLKIQSEWTCAPSECIPDEEFEEFGYRACRSMLQRQDRPDGLIIYPDIAVRGATIAILESGVKVPSELKLALHQNEGGRTICPLPATWMISSEREFARALIRQLKALFEGREVQPIFLPAIVKS